MKQEITNKVTKSDYDKVYSMVQHRSGLNSKLHPDIEESSDGYTINGISHIDLDKIETLEMMACVQSIKDLLNEKLPEERTNKKTKKVKITSVENIGYFKESEPVYDISMNSSNHMFFGNDVLIHNTDSVMFSAKKAWDDANKGKSANKEIETFVKEAYKDFEWNKDNVEQLYLMVAGMVDDSFPDFMNTTFNTGIDRGRIIAAGLEIIGTRGIFLKKKRYTILKYHEDGDRLDKDGKPGKLKNMGTELKRSDTPKYVQDFLEELMMDLLTGEEESVMRTKVMDFKREFVTKPAWHKGMPKTIKGMSKYQESFEDINIDYLERTYDKTKGCSVGHAVASFNWNKLRELNGDFESLEITDGMKITVCDIKGETKYGRLFGKEMKKIAYPTEQERLPVWFKELPFDTDSMGTNVINKKLDNVFGILDMDIGIHDDISVDLDNNDLFSW